MEATSSTRAMALLGLAAVGTLVACQSQAGSGVGGSWRAEREQRGDTMVVRTVGGSVWGDTMTLAPELAIGELEGEDPYLFGLVSGLDVDSRGRVYVVDRQAQNVRVFSHEGRHLLTIGRAGDGPGEFRRPDYVRVVGGGRIVVRDSPWRFTVFSPQGEYVGGWPVLSGFSTSTPFFVDAQGRIVNPTVPGALVRYGLDGPVLDTVPVPSEGHEAPKLEVPMTGGRATYSIPFTPSEKWTVTRDGWFHFGRTDRYRLERWGP